MKMTLLLTVIISIFLYCPVEAISQDIEHSDNALMARVGDRLILDDEFQRILVQYRKRGDMGRFLDTLTFEGKKHILNELIEQKLLAIEASRRRIDKEPEVRKAIQDAVDNIMADFLISKEISRLDLSHAGLLKFYDENPNLFSTKPRVKARHINTRTEEEAAAALTEVRNGRDFSEIAAKRNIDSSRRKGGDLGWVVKGIMVKPFEEALFSLEEGQVSDIIKTSFGFHIIKAEEIDKGKLKPFDTVKDKVKKQIIDQHISQLKKNLRKKYPVKINRELLLK